MVARYVDGKLVTEGEKVVIGGEHYKVIAANIQKNYWSNLDK